MDTMHLFQSGSNDPGHVRNLGNCSNMIFLNSNSSSCGNTGYSHVPLGVHCLITSFLKMASFANFWHKVPVEHSVLSLTFSSRTSRMLHNKCFWMSEGGKAPVAFERRVTGQGSDVTDSGVTECCEYLLDGCVWALGVVQLGTGQSLHKTN